MRAYTYTELHDSFKYYNRFQNPADENGLFPDRVINKLIILCTSPQKPTEPDDLYEERQLLSEEIERVKIYIKTNQEQVDQIVRKYRSYSPHEQETVKELFKTLLDLGMYMRGWSGKGKYPLSSEEASHTSDEYPDILIRVTDNIVGLDNKIETVNNDLEGLGDLFKSLPLIHYNGHSNELYPSTDIEEGLTIYERINIVKGGENGSIQSCIRMSSNKFVASAYYYMKLLGMELPFVISDMAEIF
jgi:hypothetical protein